MEKLHSATRPIVSGQKFLYSFKNSYTVPHLPDAQMNRHRINAGLRQSVLHVQAQ